LFFPSVHSKRPDTSATPRADPDESPPDYSEMNLASAALKSGVFVWCI
jgi:hypothetical protein